MDTLTFFAKKTPSFIWDAIYLFFSPLRGFHINIDHIHSEENYSPDELYAPLRFIHVIRDSASYNQGEFSQYWYLASQKHKKIRLEFERNRDTNKLRNLSTNLIDFLNLEFHRAALKNFKFMHDYFDPKDIIEPRICIKGYFHTSDNDTVITVFRDRKVDYEPSTPLGDNTGFDHVHQRGKYYLCNDIYDAAIKGEYKNPRLDMKYLNRSSKAPFIKLRKTWSSFWNDSGIKEENNSHYRSTLIVPMTFWNSSLDDEFLRALSILPSQKRTIFGFLCIDHPKAGYFKEESDVSIAYYFADILSQYLFSRVVYTYISKTQKKLKEYLDDHPAHVNDQELEQLLESFIIKNKLKPKSVTEIDESREEENYTYKIDNELYEYIDRVNKFSTSKEHL